jgi:hypothetical protein
MKFHGAGLWLSIHSYCSDVTEPDVDREVDVSSHRPIRSFVHSFILGSLSRLPSLSPSPSPSLHIAYFPRTSFMILAICAGQNGAGLYFWNFQEQQLEGVCVTLFFLYSPWHLRLVIVLSSPELAARSCGVCKHYGIIERVAVAQMFLTLGGGPCFGFRRFHGLSLLCPSLSKANAEIAARFNPRSFPSRRRR